VTGPDTPVAVLGAGAWGTTFAKVLADAGREVRLWSREESVARAVNEQHRNSRFLPGIDLPAGITGTSDPAAALAGAGIVVVAIPSQVARAALAPLAPLIEPGAVVVSLMKGVELSTDRLMSEVVAESLGIGADRIVVVSGPNLAKEIAVGQPTATVVASTNPAAAQLVAQACGNAYFRPYTNDDVVGIELCGAVKNVIALAVGIGEGLGYGWNTAATVINRGLVEMTRLGLALGARAETFSGLAGMGDLVATCASPLSRNHSVGHHLGKGLTVEEAIAATGGTAEGVKSSQSVLELAAKHGVEMPITQGVMAVVTGALSVQELGPLLLSRPPKAEGI
jgi:glycerol-3-phosphate dehydrogenase (NAD(P)+)